MLLFSYGSGCASTMLSMTVLRKPLGFEPLTPMLINRVNLSYAAVCDINSRRKESRKMTKLPPKPSQKSLPSTFYLVSPQERQYKTPTMTSLPTRQKVGDSKEALREVVKDQCYLSTNKVKTSDTAYQSCSYGLIPAWSSNVDIVMRQMTKGKSWGLVDLPLTDKKMDGRHVTVGDKKLLNFGLCSYSGLHLNPKLLAGAKRALDAHGVQFSCSRAYMSTTLNQELEKLMDKMTAGYTLVAQTTTLIHMATMPSFIHENDIVLIDRQAHASIQMAAKILRCHGTHVQVIPHNALNAIAQVTQKEKTRKVWYLADGIYSMYGDYAPLEQLHELQRTNPNLYLYIDDAHGLSWTGKNGCGYALDYFNPITDHERVIVVSSLSKAFGAGGGLAVFPTEEMRNKVLRVGGPMVFGGPLQNPVLGALIESAKIHLSNEVEEIQQNVLGRIDLCNRLLQKHGLPVVSYARIPIKFIACGPLSVARKLSCELKQRGFLVNVASFPAVPMDKSGIRFTLHNWLRSEDIQSLVQEMAILLPQYLREHGRSIKDIESLFKMKRKTSLKELPATEVTLEAPSDSLYWCPENQAEVPDCSNQKSTIERQSLHGVTFNDQTTTVTNVSHAQAISTLVELEPSTAPNRKQRGKRVRQSLPRFFRKRMPQVEKAQPKPKSKKEEFAQQLPVSEVTASLCTDTQSTARSSLTIDFEQAPLVLEHHHSIHDINKKKWDDLIGKNSSTDSQTLELLEQHHRNANTPEQRWKFHYLMVRDPQSSEYVMAALFTETLWKDDMMDSEHVSEVCERNRRTNLMYQTSRVLMMGSMFTLGDSLWIDEVHPGWQMALRLVIDRMDAEQKACGAKMLTFQYVEGVSPQIQQVLEDEGFISKAQPSLMFSEPLENQDEWLQSMKKCYRSHVKKHVLKIQDDWKCHVMSQTEVAKLEDHLLGLYHQVHQKALKFNTFPLNDGMIRSIMRQPNSWEFLLITHKDAQLPDAFVACAKRRDTYAALFCGLNYRRSSEGAYRHMLFWIIARGRELQYHTNVQLGFTAEREKKRVGCYERSAEIWMRIQDKDLEGEFHPMLRQ